MPDRTRLQVVPRVVEESLETPVRGLMWSLGLGAFGLAWSITTVAAYLPPVLGEFTHSATLIGLVRRRGDLRLLHAALRRADERRDPLAARPPRPFMVLALVPMAVSSRCSRSCPHSRRRRSPSSASSSRTTSTSRPTAASTSTSCRTTTSARASSTSCAGPRSAPRSSAAGSCSPLGAVSVHPRGRRHPGLVRAVVMLVHEHDVEPTRYERFRSILAPWHVVRREKHVRRFIANTAWEATFAGMRTFVVLYIIDGSASRSTSPRCSASSRPVTSSPRSRPASSRRVRRRQRHPRGLRRLRIRASVAGFAQIWHWWYYALIAPVAMAGGVVMTLAWALLFKVMPAKTAARSRASRRRRRESGSSSGRSRPEPAIDIFHGYFRSTDGYAVIWPVVAIPVLAVIPLVALLAEAEGNLRGTGRRPAS